MSKSQYTEIHQPDRRSFLEMATLGVLGVVAGTSETAFIRSVFADTASSGKELIVHSTSPMNAEPALKDLVQSWITPVKYFYVRSHAPTPQLDIGTFRIRVEGLVDKPREFSVAELKERFPATSAVVTMTCAGNRRSEHSLTKPVSGVQWGAGPIGNAKWSGIALADLLQDVGLKAGANHVWFESVDRVEKDGEVIPFGGSVPLQLAMIQYGAVPAAMAAFEMNDAPLAADHGFPVRMVVPGMIGARSVKWLGKIVVSDRPSPNHYFAGAYKLVTEDRDEEWDAALPIYHFPINSAICTPAENAKLKSGTIRVAGYALPGGVICRKITKVEVSMDGGQHWTQAELGPDSRDFCWRLWHADVRVTPKTTQLVVRAFDNGGAAQPETVKWNLKGYLYNAWHRVGVSVT